MKSLRGLAVLTLLLLAACTGPPEGIKVEPKPAPAPSPSPLDKLDAAEIPEETRKLVGLSELVAFVRGHNRAVSALAFSPDGKRLATSGWDNAVVLWDMTGAEPKEIAKLEGSPSGVAFIADGKRLVTGGPDQRVIVWDIAGDKPKLRTKLGGHKASPFAIQATPNGLMLASGSLNPRLRVWKFDVVEAETWAVIVGENAPALGISSLSFSSDGKLLASGAHLGKPSLRIWDVSGGVMEERTLPAAQARLVQFSPKEPLLAFAADDPTIYLWSVAGNEPKSLHELNGDKATKSTPAIKALAFTPDGKVLASGGVDRLLIFWNVAKGEEIRTLPLLDEVRALAFAPDGRHLAVGNDDGTISILRLKW
jgi:WD40 repeat protein